ncbi:MAG: hypothetical protein KAT34_16930, partial [Candidatus Aminicenantes bacterium]|nr:hypothetical protein [Candidatus Aminicenantes bacterium]
EFAERTGVERIGVFGFSEEEGTGAFHYKERVSPEIIELREQLLMDISDRNMEIYNEKLIDTVREFIPLGPWEGGMTVGRIMSQSPETDGFTLVNETFVDNYNIYKIKITGFKNESLYGEMI